MTEGTTEHVTCLGCGCACDDIAVVVKRGRIVEAHNACALGTAWFGDGVVPAEIRLDGRAATLDQAIGKIAALLLGANRPLVYIAGDLSCEAQRETVAIADRLHAALDSLAATAADSVLAAQRRGRASATLGEIRERTDLIVFWGVDPSDRYPRFSGRYAERSGGARRTVVSADVGAHRGPQDADLRMAFAAADEVDALGVMRAAVGGRDLGAAERFGPAIELARRMMQAKYVAIVVDGEPGGGTETSTIDPDRAEALIALAQALNGPTRCALATLRAGGNRSGADAVLTWLTGFPFAVDFAGGTPSYRPAGGGARALLAGREVDAALVVGAAATLPGPIAQGLVGGGGALPVAIIGPRASTAALRPVVAIDTGVAGIHDGGTAFRMDDVPLPLRPSLDGPPGAPAVVRALRDKLGHHSNE
jgi:formylmethanofuran dehydrogenase subunit B